GVSTSGVDFWHAVEFSRNGRFLCTHPLGLSSGAFVLFRVYQIFSDRISSVLSGFCAFALSLSGGSDSIRSFPPDFPASTIRMKSRVHPTWNSILRGVGVAELVQFEATV
ncbi:hypothetical protein, partial [Streptomyces sp. NPDC059708]|uniref:hypothetical protein n=1 Tax=Streptomyces sp. NPDC059708 TaxID=3346916 RepID=UPI0036C12E67